MGKLGKKARKFAKKNLQSVLRRKRKLKSVFKKKASKKDERAEAEGVEADETELSITRNNVFEGTEDASLDAVFGEDESDEDADDSDSDGYLSEDESFSLVGETELDSHLEDKKVDGTLPVQNNEARLELAKKMNKLKRLKDKDPDFAKFLESNKKRLKALRDEEIYSDDDEASDSGGESADQNTSGVDVSKMLSSSSIDALYRLAKEQQSIPAFIRLLNAYRAACHCGTDSSSVIQDSFSFSKIVMLLLAEADDMFRKMLGVSLSNERKEAILELKNTSKWKATRPLIKSYLRSTLQFLNVVTDHQILAFVLTRVRASMMLFVAFPALLRRLIKVSVHLWAAGQGTLSVHSFLIIHDVAAVNSECFETCFIKIYGAFIGHCKSLDPVLLKHVRFLKSSFVELCSRNMHKSLSKVENSTQQLVKILQIGLQTKRKEAVKKVCSWQYINCIDLWVEFISLYIHDYDLQPLLYMICQIINGVAILFPGPRYLPLRVKCIQWLNQLSSSSGIFIPIASLTLDLLEYKIGKESLKPGSNFNFSSALKFPKYWLKSRNFQEECVLSTVELLVAHFAQWSYHISFPELATIPLIRLRKFHETTTIEGLRRVVKRFIDQVEQNIEFVRKKRDEVAFSPKDEQSVESFLQLERSSNTPFTQYYGSMMEKAATRNLLFAHK
ncbi:hypothetical protein K2173_011686 [Erythroxylum novogranatense]|uniref:Nucleolar complex protein 2 homolog n=1 Tax=Erythroxylum novogranatense TaxID=1862640 RepID=A0AAV8T2D2_9ROSI|nr:hypothetical protein K2173_011686 [Erythroxylum novogranatense]